MRAANYGVVGGKNEAEWRKIFEFARKMELYGITTESVKDIDLLEKLAKETEFAAGYVRVKTPHIAKEKMYLTSGHLPVLYAESMFPAMRLPVENEADVQSRMRKIRENLRAYGGLAAMCTLTAPGVHGGLVWDRASCTHDAGERCGKAYAAKSSLRSRSSGTRGRAAGGAS